MVFSLERGADLHTAQLMPLPLTVCCFSKIQIGFTFLVPAHPGSPRQRAVKWVCVCYVNVPCIVLLGWRIGKGFGFSDLEYAMLASVGAISPEVPVVTIVHDSQVSDGQTTIAIGGVKCGLITFDDSVLKCKDLM